MYIKFFDISNVEEEDPLRMEKEKKKKNANGMIFINVSVAEVDRLLELYQTERMLVNLEKAVSVAKKEISGSKE